MAIANQTKKENKTKLFSYILPIFSALIVVAVIFATIQGGVKIRVECNGQTLGFVDDIGVYENAKDILEEKMSHILGVKYKFDAAVNLDLSYGENQIPLNEEELFKKMYSAVAKEKLSEAYALYVDDKFVAANTDLSVLQNALRKVTELVSSQYEGTVEIANKIYFRNRPVAKESVYTQEELISLLCNATVEYAADGEAIALRAYEGNGSQGCNFENTYYTDVNFDGENSTLLLYKTTVVEEYEESIPYKTVYRDSSKYYEGMTYVQVEGEFGLRDVVASASYINGEEVEREVLSYEVTREAVDKVVLVGTRPKPPTAPTGTFIIPINSPNITSRYGWRKIFGGQSFHSGMDFMAKVGTMLYASDGGEIVRAKYSGAYGLMVEIDHGGKYRTIYAHMSALLVKAGDKVYQGQPIGLSGQTGRVTGPHLHFEIYEQGVRKNPALFLKNITPDMVLKLSEKEMEELRNKANYLTAPNEQEAENPEQSEGSEETQPPEQEGSTEVQTDLPAEQEE